MLFLAGDPLVGDRCNPALIAAAAWRLDKDGERGDGGLGRDRSGAVMEILRGRGVGAEGEGGSVFRSGAISVSANARDWM